MPFFRFVAILAVLTPTAAAAAGAPVEGISSYHNRGRRAGAYVVAGMTAAAAMRLEPSFDGSVDGRIYAQPLYWRPAGAAHGRIVVATEHNVVAALDAESGCQLWANKLGEPMPGSALPCGNVSPVGITGAPVIDPDNGVVYVVALEQLGGDAGHRVHALSMRDGTELRGWPVVPAALEASDIFFNSRIQNQRGALDLFWRVVYVPFGGNWDDCRRYHGVVVGLDAGRRPIAAEGRLYVADDNRVRAFRVDVEPAPTEVTH